MAKRKTIRRPGGGDELNITSMMDMMTIILVFLLKSYGAEDISAAGNDDLVLPVSSSVKSPKIAVNVIVSRRNVVVDGQEIMQLVEEQDPTTGEMVVKVADDDKRASRILPLYDILSQKADTAKQQAERVGGGDQFDFKGQLLLQCDKRLPFSVVREVMYTAGQAQFSEFRFVVIKGSG